MNDYWITFNTVYGDAVMQIEAENHSAATVLAQMIKAGDINDDCSDFEVNAWRE